MEIFNTSLRLAKVYHHISYDFSFYIWVQNIPDAGWNVPYTLQVAK